ASGFLFSLFGSQSVIAVPDGISLNVATLDHERLGLSSLAGGGRKSKPATKVDLPDFIAPQL
ncbi:hypothetical protein AB9F35_35005, partial [Rhizobium leguminosarum]|uniref:hypothetical protein n=1 Tax=Rhizobium leguminosarum TaxID=384 RepID=UPI003F989521